MSIASYIVIALALALSNMLQFRRSGEVTPIRLSTGVFVALLVAVVHSALYYLGGAIGSLLRISSPDSPTMYADVNAYIFLGLAIVVAVKLVFPYLKRNPQLPVFRLDQLQSVFAMALASGINVCLVGIGTGFVESGQAFHRMVWPMLACIFLFGYLGLMFGRQKVQMRPRRWIVIAGVLLVGVGIAAVVNV